MTPFRWPAIEQDLALAKEVIGRKPEKTDDWDAIANALSEAFSLNDKVVVLKGRGCRERMERLLEKFHRDDAKALKRSGTEEEYSELAQLCEDISAYRHDVNEMKMLRNESKKKKAEDEKKKAEEMRIAAMKGLAKRRSISGLSSSDESDDNDDLNLKTTNTPPSKKPRQRASKQSAMEVLAQKYAKKAEFKNQELDLRKQELEFQKRKFELEEVERKSRLELELEERKAIISLLKNRIN